MGDLVKDITYTGESRKIKKASAWEFNYPFRRANKDQEEKYRKTLNKISDDFKTKYVRQRENNLEVSEIYARLSRNNFVSG